MIPMDSWLAGYMYSRTKPGNPEIGLSPMNANPYGKHKNTMILE